MLRKILILAVLLSPTIGHATTYFVDPSGAGACATNDARAGTSTGTFWCTPPGTRTTNNSGLLRTTWGSISTGAKIQCGDTILLKGGSSHTSTQGGSWTIYPDYYSNTCTAGNPITIRVATSADWAGASGNFIFNGVGITPTSNVTYNFTDHPGDIMVDVPGVALLGASSSQRLVITGAGWVSGGYAVAVQSPSLNLDGFLGDQWTISDSNKGIAMGHLDGFLIKNVSMNNLDGFAIDCGLNADVFTRHGAFVDVGITNSGASAGLFDDAINVFRGESLWFIRNTVSGDAVGAVSVGTTAGAGNNNGQPSYDWVTRFRDFISWGNGSNFSKCAAGNSCVGWKSSGGDGFTAFTVKVYLLGGIIYGNGGEGVHGYASDAPEMWNVTLYNNGRWSNALGDIRPDATSRAFSVYNSISVKAPTSFLLGWNNSGNAPGPPAGQNIICGYTPTFLNNCFRPLNSNAEGMFGATGCTWANGGTTYATPPTMIGATNKTTLAACDPQFVALSTASFAANDFRLCEGPGVPSAACIGTSTAIDAGRFYLLANGAGSGNTINVKANGGSSNPDSYFVSPTSYLTPSVFDTRFQIQGTCGVRHVVSMTSTSITFDGASCSWADNAGIHLPWSGNGVDMGGVESGGIVPTTTSTTPVPTTTSTTSTTIQGTATSFWDPSVVGTIDSTDTAAVELGVKFQSGVAGNITAVKYYKSPTSTGVHIGNVWTAAGVNLGSVTFTGETASGWQTQNLVTPIHINANTTYVVSYFAPAGHYVAALNYFSTFYNNSPFHLFATSETPNGVFLYNATSAFPINTFQANNYWADIVFAADSQAPPTTTSTVTTTSSSTSTSSSTAPGATSSTSTTLRSTTTSTTPPFPTTSSTTTTSTTLPQGVGRRWYGGSHWNGLRRGL